MAVFLSYVNPPSFIYVTVQPSKPNAILYLCDYKHFVNRQRKFDYVYDITNGVGKYNVKIKIFVMGDIHIKE